MTERQFQRHVEGLARYYGWRVFHAPDNMPSTRTGRLQRVTPGFPDLVLLRPPDLIFAELKTDTGRLSAAQVEWIGDISQVGSWVDGTWYSTVEAHVWRPQHAHEINERLARGRKRMAWSLADEVTPPAPEAA